MSEPAYHLRTELFEGKSHDIVCRIVEFPGWDDNLCLAGPWPPVRTTEPVHFDTNFELLEQVPDFPNNTARWPIMSRRMLDVLLSVGNFAHNEVPVVLIDDTIDVEVRLDVFGRPRPQYSKSDYVAVQLTNHGDFLDLERSRYNTYSWKPSAISAIYDHVFHIPPEGLPPLFRLTVYEIKLFVSAKARAALEAADIRGPRFYRPNQW